ncbi:MAG: hypothetical protein ACR2IE_03235 [Candidatus Sumerlaeaceae bacterium]
MEAEIQDLLIQLRSSDYRIYRDILYVIPWANPQNEPHHAISAGRLADALRNHGRDYNEFEVHEALENMRAATPPVMQAAETEGVFIPTEFGRRVIDAFHPEGHFKINQLKPFPKPVRRIA